MAHTTGYVEVGDGKLYYEMAGSTDSGATLVLGHAGFVDSRMWDDHWDEFTQHYRVVRFDMRGYGKSDVVKTPVARRDDLYGLLKQLKTERAHLLGCSMSGEVMLDFTLEHPEMVATLITVSTVPSGFEMRGEPPRYLFEMMGAVQQGDLERAAELQTRIWVDGQYREPEQVNPLVRQRAREMSLIPLTNGTWANDAQPVNPLTPPAVGRLQEIRVPTLIVAGALDHPEILRAADVMQSTIVGAKKIIMEDCAHVPNMEQASEFNRAVLGFLGRAG